MQSACQKITSATSPRWARKHISILIFLIFQFSIFNLQSCGLDVEDSTPPSPPVWVEKSFPEEWPEHGVDAHESGGIYLEWKANPVEENVSEYRIYKRPITGLADSLSDYEQIVSIVANELDLYHYVDRFAESYVNNVYRLQAVDQSGNISAYSDTAAYVLMYKISPYTLVPNGQRDTLNSARELEWHFSYHALMETYVITILSESNSLQHRSEFYPSTYVGGTEKYSIPVGVLLEHGKAYRWRIDLMGDYFEGKEQSGSESVWAYFYYFQSQNNKHH